MIGLNIQKYLDLRKDQAMTQSEIEKVKLECWDQYIHTLGTSYIFGERVKFFKFCIKIITLLSLFVPTLLGASLLTWGVNSEIVRVMLIIAGVLSVAQAGLSSISLIYKWDDELIYSMESQTENNLFHDEYKRIAEYFGSNNEVFSLEFQILKTKNAARSVQDNKHPITSREMRLGMRYALLMQQRPCAICKKIPLYMDEKSECGNCGKLN